MSDNPFLDMAGVTPQDAFSSSVASAIPGAVITSGLRTPQQQAALIAAGATTATKSPHLNGNGFDMRPVDGMTAQQAFQKLKNAGLPVNQVIDEQTQGTGPHWHFRGDFGGSIPAMDERASPTPADGSQPNPFLAMASQKAPDADIPTPPPPQLGGGATPVDPGIGNPVPSGGDVLSDVGEGVHDFGLGAMKGAGDLLGTGAWLSDKALGTDLQKTTDRMQDNLSAREYDPNGWGNAIGRIGGNILSVAPVAEIKTISKIPAIAAAMEAAKVADSAAPAATNLAAALGRYGDMAAQGAAGGFAASGGKDVALNTALGAGGAPLLGAALDKIGPKIVALGDKAGSSKLAQALRDSVAPVPDAGPMVEKTIGRGPQSGDFIDTPTGKALYVEITPSDLGSAGSRSGIESTTDLPPEVATHVSRLVEQGIPKDQALREADITAIGGKPTVAAVTRDPAEQAAMWEGAKQSTPEGAALSAQIAQNNAAVHNAIQGAVDNFGGVPNQGEAAETAARSLANSSDAEYSKVSELYKAADDEAAALKGRADDLNQQLSDAYKAKGAALYSGGGGKPIAPPPDLENAPGYIDISDLRRAINTPEMMSSTVDGVKTLRNGIKGMLVAYGDRVNLRQAETIRQAINDAYNPLGGGVNRHVGNLKAVLDASLDKTDAGPAYKAARAGFKDWASAYENPDGIARLIRRDAQGNFLNEGNWRQAENFITSSNDQHFGQIVDRLRANGDTQAINRLKASTLQRAYEAATSNATDQLGNSTVQGKRFFDTLNRMGTAKLNKLFSGEERAQIATFGRAAIALNSPVPGSYNSSNTASALARALGDVKTADKPSFKGKLAMAAGHVALGPVTHGTGSIALEGLSGLRGAMKSASRQKALAEALRLSMSPEAARAAQKAEAARLAEGLSRSARARRISENTAPLVAYRRKEN